MGIGVSGVLKLWQDVLTKPEKVFNKEKKHASLKEAAEQLAYGFGAVGFVSGLMVAFLAFLVAIVPGLQVFAGFGIAAIIIAPLFTIILGWIGAFLAIAVLWLFAKLYGGKGSFEAYAYLISLFVAPLYILKFIAGLVPVLGGLVTLAIMIYGLYLLTIATKVAHGFDNLKAVLTWLVPAFLMGVIVVLLGIALIATVTALLAGAALAAK